MQAAATMELCRLPLGDLPSARAELTSLLRFAGDDCSTPTVRSLAVAHRVCDLFALVAGMRCRAIAVEQPHATVWRIEIPHAQQSLTHLGLISRTGRHVHGLPPRVITRLGRDGAAILRGAVLAAGTLRARRVPHLTIVAPTTTAAVAVTGAWRRLQPQSRIRPTGTAVSRITVRGTETVALLAAIGAPTAALRAHDLAAARPGRSRRQSTAEDPHRIAAAAAMTINVRHALDILGDAVPDHLLAAAHLRIAYPHAALSTLAELAAPVPMTKDIVAGRLRRLIDLADRADTPQHEPRADIGA